MIQYSRAPRRAMFSGARVNLICCQPINIWPYIWPDIKLDIWPDTQPDTWLDIRQGIRLDTWPDIWLDTQPNTQLDTPAEGILTSMARHHPTTSLRRLPLGRLKCFAG